MVTGQINRGHYARGRQARVSRITNIGEETYPQPYPACGLSVVRDFSLRSILDIAITKGIAYHWRQAIKPPLPVV